jgi:hypothetical protein
MMARLWEREDMKAASGGHLNVPLPGASNRRGGDPNSIGRWKSRADPPKRSVNLRKSEHFRLSAVYVNAAFWRSRSFANGEAGYGAPLYRE